MDVPAEQRFVVLRDVEAYCFVSNSSMLSELRTVRVKAGEVLLVRARPPLEGSSVGCTPHRYEALEAEYVDADVRKQPGYRGYHLVVTGRDFSERCRLLSD